MDGKIQSVRAELQWALDEWKREQRIRDAATVMLAALENLLDLCEQTFFKPNECTEVIDARTAIALATQVQS